ncbi:hypothetical protein Bca52824_008214 [Brassica carinata]|uniref:non-specific serine/threonine protein kinase n=1 Tax=Brassica carinata TaxID=52824 RepID=A0A8X7W8U0_BRACI|nr:hypothetical protein Bca52824_008214 [Brassica carinata]
MSILFRATLALFFTLFHSSHGYFLPTGSVGIGYNGYFTLTNTTKHAHGQAFDSNPVSFTNSSTNITTSFSINFFFAIVPEHNHQGSHGMAFVISPTRGLPGASSDQYLGIFNETNNGKSSNNVVAIELDIHRDEEFGDIDDNHVGVNINGMRSVVSASAGYYDDKDGKFRKLSLISREVMRLSIVYSQLDKQLNVTLFPANISVPPRKPLLSLNKDLSPYLLEEEMYLGFTASTGSVGAIHYMMGWFITGEIEFPRLEFGMLPILPRYPKKASHRTKIILAVCLTVSVIAAFIASWIGFVFYLRHKKVKEVLEEWEIQYGPHRFAYKELFDATKGFREKQLLGRGGFGQVYKGALPGSDAEIAVKRTSHDSRQGMSEFLAEISTIGRLRHPNLVRLLGYCRHKEDLYLVYDFMPNGSLDKYLYYRNNENQERLTWEQRYIAPEFLRTGRATTSTDVYAFGLVMLEVVCGRRLIERRAGEDEEVLVDWILELWEKGEDILVAVEENIRQEQNRRELELVLKLGVLCSHQAASIRPAMSAVMRILSGVSELPDNLLDVVRDEKLRGWTEEPMELLFDVNSLGTSTYTDSLVSHAR